MCSSVFVFILVLCLCESVNSCSRNFTHADGLWNCSKQSLFVIPQPPDISVIILKLDLSYNNINSPFSFDAWANSPLEEIDLSHNNLMNISDFSFTNMKNLTSLDLSHNKLVFIPDAMLDHLPLLTTLDLSGNLDLGKFNSFTSLLKKIMKSNVSFLYLSSVGLDSLPYDVLIHSKTLISLDLSQNCMKVIPKLPKVLEYLDFSHTCIQHIDPDCFDVDTHLKNLSLEYNVYLSDVRPESFNHLVSLTKLSFRGCSKFSRLPGSLFDYNSKLKYLSLAECNFKEISVTFKESFLKIDYIDLHGNPWNCSKAIKWFFQLPNATTMNGTLRCSDNRSLAEALGPAVEAGRLVLAVSTVLVAALLLAAAFVACRTERSRRRTPGPYTPLVFANPPLAHPRPIVLTSAV